MFFFSDVTHVFRLKSSSSDHQVRNWFYLCLLCDLFYLFLEVQTEKIYILKKSFFCSYPLILRQVCVPSCASLINTSTHLCPGEACAGSRHEPVQFAVHLDAILVVTCGTMMTPPAADDDLVSAGQWLESNAALVEQWLKRHASAEFRRRVQEAVADARCNSVTPDLFQRWLVHPPALRPTQDLEDMEENELFMELIRDVANELDIDVLCHKILRNVSLLTRADRGSLFLTRGAGEEKYLVAKLFDVRHDTSLEEAVKMARSEEIRIPFGVGIAGTVAKNKILINITDAYNVSACFAQIQDFF